MALPKPYEDFDDLELEPLSDEELDWVEAHWDELRKQYGGQWIAVLKDSIVAHGPDLVDVGKDVEAKGIKNPFYTWVLPEDVETLPIIL
jgi:hypothetical protein